jgi:hypothetical protein
MKTAAFHLNRLRVHANVNVLYTGAWLRSRSWMESLRKSNQERPR